jgi:hypothetical protein
VSALQPVSEALYAVLNVASLKAAHPTGAGCTGGITEAPGQGPTFPFLWYELRGRDIGGLGAGLDLAEIELRLHVFSQAPGMTEARRIMTEAVRLLKYTQPTVVGHHLVKIGRPLDEVPLPFEEINGVAVRELVTTWNLFTEEQAA